MKKIISLILSILVITAYFPVSAFADETVPEDTPPEVTEPDDTHKGGVIEVEEGVSYGASIEYKGNTYLYKDLKSALDDAEEGDTVMLRKSFAISEYYYINPSVKVTIDLAGYSITSGNSKIYIGYDGQDTYTDSDVTVTDSVGGGRITAGSSQAVIYVSSGTFTLAGGTISNSYNPVNEYSYGIYAKRGSKVNITGGSIAAKVGVRGLPADISMSGGSITASAVGVFLNGSDTQKSEFSMTGGYISGNENVGIFAHSYASINVWGGEITGRYGIQTEDTSEVNIFGGEISGTTASFAVIGNCSCTLTDGQLSNSVLIDGDGATFIMNGGKVTGSGSDAAVITGGDMGGSCNVKINGGYITATDNGMYLTQKGKVTISGGTISGGNNAVMQTAGTLEISPVSDSDVLIYASGTPAAGGSAADNGASEEGTALALIDTGDKDAGAVLDIQGGTFRSDYGMGLWIYRPDDAKSDVKVSVSGGNFTGGTYAQKKYASCASRGMTGYIKGGIFNTDISSLAAFGYDLNESAGMWTVSDSMTYTKETSEESTDDAGNKVVTHISQGQNLKGDTAEKTVVTTKDSSGNVISEVKTVKRVSEKYTLITISEESSVNAVFEFAEGFDDSFAAECLDRLRGTYQSEGIKDISAAVTVNTSGQQLTVSKKLLEAADGLTVNTPSGTFRLTSGDIEYILQTMAGESFTVSAESLADIRDIRVSNAKNLKAYLSSVSLKDGKVTAAWNRVQGADGYVLTLITGGKTYTQEIDSPDTTSFTFEQNVTKSYRVRISTYSYVDDEKIVSSSTYKTSVAKPVYSSASKNSKTGKVTVKWKKRTDVDGFRVQMVIGNRTYTKYVKGTATSCTFTPKVTKSYRIKLSSYSVIEGKKVYSSAVTKTYIAKPVMTRLSKNKSNLKVTAGWKKIPTVSGYRVRLNANGKTYTKTITSNSRTSYTFNVKVKGTYTVSIATYSVFGGTRYYSDYRTYKVN